MPVVIKKPKLKICTECHLPRELHLFPRVKAGNQREDVCGVCKNWKDKPVGQPVIVLDRSNERPVTKCNRCDSDIYHVPQVVLDAGIPVICTTCSGALIEAPRTEYHPDYSQMHRGARMG